MRRIAHAVVRRVRFTRYAFDVQVARLHGSGHESAVSQGTRFEHLVKDELLRVAGMQLTRRGGPHDHGADLVVRGSYGCGKLLLGELKSTHLWVAHVSGCTGRVAVPGRAEGAGDLPVQAHPTIWRHQVAIARVILFCFLFLSVWTLWVGPEFGLLVQLRARARDVLLAPHHPRSSNIGRPCLQQRLFSLRTQVTQSMVACVFHTYTRAAL